MRKLIAIAVLFVGSVVVMSQNLIPPANGTNDVFFAEWHLESGTVLHLAISTNVTATNVKVKATGKEPRTMLMYETNRVVQVTKIANNDFVSVQTVNIEFIGSSVTDAPADNSNPKRLHVEIPKRKTRMTNQPAAK